MFLILYIFFPNIPQIFLSNFHQHPFLMATIADIECGALVSMAAYCLLNGLELNYSMNWTDYFRIHMAMTIIKGRPDPKDDLVI